MIRLLLDEHIPSALRRELVRQNAQLIVWRVGDPGGPPIGTSDPAILHWCEEHEFVLLTSNRRTMPDHLRRHLADGAHVPGILIARPTMSMGELVEELILIVECGEAADLRDQLIYLPLV